MRKLISVLVCSFAAAQTPQFEVASIKVAPPPEPGKGMRVWMRGGPGSNDPGLFTCGNVELAGIISRAYGLASYEFPTPDWMRNTRFNMSARIPEGTTKEQFVLMLQSFLAERFKLTFHREKKDMQGFELVLVKAGPKFKEHADTPASDEDGKPASQAGTDANGYPTLPAGRGSMMRAIQGGFSTQRFDGETMAQLAAMLSSRVGGPVNDSTGLTGKYDFMLRWIMDGGIPNPDSPGPTITQAIQEQLGLKLQPKKVPVNLFIVDHVEKVPTEN